MEKINIMEIFLFDIWKRNRFKYIIGMLYSNDYHNKRSFGFYMIFLSIIWDLILFINHIWIQS